MKSPIVKITTKTVKDSLVPQRAIAYRRDGSRLEAGDKFLRLAIVTLYALITGEHLLPKVISKKIKNSRVRANKKVLEVL